MFDLLLLELYKSLKGISKPMFILWVTSAHPQVRPNFTYTAQPLLKESNVSVCACNHLHIIIIYCVFIQVMLLLTL